MKTSNIIIFTLIMVLLSSIALAVSPVKKPVLYFNPLETRQAKGDNAWKNAGTAGGEVSKGEGKPTLEEGPIEIPSIGFKADHAAWYTATKSRSVFANEAEDKKAPVVHLENFTIGLLIRVNGPYFAEENIIIGIQTEGKIPPRAHEQNVRIWLDVARQRHSPKCQYRPERNPSASRTSQTGRNKLKAWIRTNGTGCMLSLKAV